jgi:hypothetical protein
LLAGALGRQWLQREGVEEVQAHRGDAEHVNGSTDSRAAVRLTLPIAIRAKYSDLALSQPWHGPRIQSGLEVRRIPRARHLALQRLAGPDQHDITSAHRYPGGGFCGLQVFAGDGEASSQPALPVQGRDVEQNPARDDAMRRDFQAAVLGASHGDRVRGPAVVQTAVERDMAQRIQV